MTSSSSSSLPKQKEGVLLTLEPIEQTFVKGIYDDFEFVAKGVSRILSAGAIIPEWTEKDRARFNLFGSKLNNVMEDCFQIKHVDKDGKQKKRFFGKGITEKIVSDDADSAFVLFSQKMSSLVKKSKGIDKELESFLESVLHYVYMREKTAVCLPLAFNSIVIQALEVVKKKEQEYKQSANKNADKPVATVAVEVKNKPAVAAADNINASVVDKKKLNDLQKKHDAMYHALVGEQKQLREAKAKIEQLEQELKSVITIARIAKDAADANAKSKEKKDKKKKSKDKDATSSSKKRKTMTSSSSEDEKNTTTTTTTSSSNDNAEEIKRLEDVIKVQNDTIEKLKIDSARERKINDVLMDENKKLKALDASFAFTSRTIQTLECKVEVLEKEKQEYKTKEIEALVTLRNAETKFTTEKESLAKNLCVVKKKYEDLKNKMNRMVQINGSRSNTGRSMDVENSSGGSSSNVEFSQDTIAKAQNILHSLRASQYLVTEPDFENLGSDEH